MLFKNIKEIDKRNKDKKGISFYQMHKGHKQTHQYMFIEKPIIKNE